MKRLILVIFAGIILWSLPVLAEMYRYKDVNGTIRFTDNLADVPEKQRQGLSVYENTPSRAAPSVAEQPSGRNTPNGQNLKVTEKPQSGDSAADSLQSDELLNDPSRIDQLLKIKTALDEENAQFIKESLSLSEAQKTLSGSAAIKSYNEKVSALNTRVDDYEKRRAAFQKAADAFDAALKKRIGPPSPPP